VKDHDQKVGSEGGTWKFTTSHQRNGQNCRTHSVAIFRFFVY